MIEDENYRQIIVTKITFVQVLRNTIKYSDAEETLYWYIRNFRNEVLYSEVTKYNLLKIMQKLYHITFVDNFLFPIKLNKQTQLQCI